MNSYVARNAETKEIVEYEAEAPLAEHKVYPWSVGLRVDYVPAGPGAVNGGPIYGGRRDLTRYEFLSLFTQEERTAIRAFASGSTAAAKQLNDFLYMIGVADGVSLTDTQVIDVLDKMVVGGLLTAERQARILEG